MGAEVKLVGLDEDGLLRGVEFLDDGIGAAAVR